MPDVPTLWDWCRRYPEFDTLYRSARLEQADAIAERILDMADDEPKEDMLGKVDAGMVAHRKLAIDTLKWRASVLKPHVYGPKVQQEHSGPGGGPIQVVTGVPRADEPTPE